MAPRLLRKTSALFIACAFFAACYPNTDSQMMDITEDNEGEEWIIYTNNDLGFTVKHPKSWMIERTDSANSWTFIGFGPPESRIGGMIWGIDVYKKSYSNAPDIETVIGEIGKQFSDRSEMREKITIGFVEALLVTVTTKKIKDWISRVVIIETPQAIYSISNGAIEDGRFENFYGSFEVL